MSLVSFLNNLIQYDGFELVDANSKKYVIGNPIREKPIVLKLLDQKLMQKLLINPDLYFGEAYMNGSLVIENGTITEFLDLAFRNIGRGDINFYGGIIKKIKGTFRYLTNFNKIVKSKENVAHHYDISEKLYDLFLDKNRQYSCAYFKNENDTLEEAQKNNPDKKRETCLSFIEKTRSQFCTIAKKQISLTNNTIREKVLTTLKKAPRIEKSIIEKVSTITDNKTNLNKANSLIIFNQSGKSPRELAIAFQVKLKEKLKNKN